MILVWKGLEGDIFMGFVPLFGKVSKKKAITSKSDGINKRGIPLKYPLKIFPIPLIVPPYIFGLSLFL